MKICYAAAWLVTLSTTTTSHAFSTAGPSALLSRFSFRDSPTATRHPAASVEAEALTETNESPPPDNDNDKKKTPDPPTVAAVAGIDEAELLQQIQEESDKLVSEMMDENCEIDYESSSHEPVDELCVEDSEERTRFRDRLGKIVRTTVQLVRGTKTDADDVEGLTQGEILEKGWEDRANASALVRNAEVWKFGLSAVFKILGARKVKLKGGTDEELQEAQTKAAEYVRDGLLTLGPSFVKLGQVMSTRTGKGRTEQERGWRQRTGGALSLDH